jgi:hypothetical protein
MRKIASNSIPIFLVIFIVEFRFFSACGEAARTKKNGSFLFSDRLLDPAPASDKIKHDHDQGYHEQHMNEVAAYMS